MASQVETTALGLILNPLDYAGMDKKVAMVGWET